MGLGLGLGFRYGQAHRQRELEGVRSNPKDFTHHLVIHFKCPTICNWPTSLAVIENHLCPNELGSSYSPHLFMEDQWMNAERVCKQKHGRKYVRK